MTAVNRFVRLPSPITALTPGKFLVPSGMEREHGFYDRFEIIVVRMNQCARVRFSFAYTGMECNISRTFQDEIRQSPACMRNIAGIDASGLVFFSTLFPNVVIKIGK
jgi:hypothetical protein